VAELDAVNDDDRPILSSTANFTVPLDQRLKIPDNATQNAIHRLSWDRDREAETEGEHCTMEGTKS
jgi:hypothetical protein